MAELIGQTAASNMVVSRMDRENKNVIFDGGDEVILSNSKSVPQRLVVADRAGTFYDHTNPLTTFAKDYAKPVIKRWSKMANKDEFRKVYLESMQNRPHVLQDECKSQENSFKLRFQRNTEVATGSFPDRWDKALTRLHETDIDVLIATIRLEIEKGV